MTLSQDNADYYKNDYGFVKRGWAKLGRMLAVRVSKTPLMIPAGFRAVTFCFDDFPASAAHAGARILENHTARGTYYLCCDLIGKNSPSGVIASGDDVKNLAQTGHDIGCHTFEHVNCSYVGPRAVSASCEKNREAASSMGIHFEHFAYPQGGITPASKRVMRNNYQTARTVMGGINRTGCDAHALKSVSLYETTSDAHINDLISDVSDNGGWLIFYTHDVSQNPSAYGVSEEKFSKTIVACQKKKIPICTVSSAIKEIREHG